MQFQKYQYPPKKGHPRGWGKAKIFEGKYEAKKASMEGGVMDISWTNTLIEN